MGSVTREQFLAADDFPREAVPVPRLGTVWVRAMTAAERERWENATDGEARSRSQVRALLVAMTACDEAGSPLFTEADVPMLAARSITTIMPLFEAALRLGKVAAADVESIEGNSGASPSDSSATGSPAT